MKIRAKMLIAAFVLALTMQAGGRIALAAETEAGGQTEQTDQTESEEQTEPVQPVGPLSPAEPSDMRGLQKDGDYLYYFDDNGFLKTGWLKTGADTYYFREAASDAPRGSAVTGISQIGGGLYYFDDAGALKTGWQTVGNKRCYCTPSGELGVLGRMAVGVSKIDGQYYYFDETGMMHTGWVDYMDKRYFFTKKKSSQSYGAAYTGWKTISKERYYFTAKGVLKRNCWVKKKYYVDDDGKLLKSCVTPDGYLVDAKGVKGKRANGFIKIGKKYYYYTSGEMAVGLKKISGKYYYFKKNGVRKENGWLTIKNKKYYIKSGAVQTGWVICSGKRYYFNQKGRMQKDKVVDGVQLAEDGTAPISVLLIAGHGQGDPGACGVYGSTVYYEQNFTRDFASRIYKQLKKLAPDMAVVMYDQNYDCYQVMSNKKSGPRPNFKAYDYVLEIHFNASNSKDSYGNGVRMGTGMYINASKSNTTLDQRIVAAVSKAGGLPIWGGGPGLHRSSGLFNARTLQAMGVSYGLLETAFIDDRDDMNAYNSNKNAMAQAVATTIRDYFGV